MNRVSPERVVFKGFRAQLGLTAAFVVVSLLFLPFVFSQEPRWALIYIIAGVGLFFLREIPRVGLIGLLFIAWAAFSLLWSPDPGEGAVGVSSMIALWVVFVLFWKHGTQDVLFWGAFIAVPVVVALGLWLPEYEAGFGNQNWTSEWLLLCMPFLLIRWYGLPAAALSAVYLAFFNPSYVEIPVLAGLLFAYFVWRRWWILVGLSAVTFGALLYVGPDFLGPDLLSSFKSRIELFLNTTYLWLESPLIGHGLGSFNYEYGRVQEKHLGLLPGWGTQMYPIWIYAGAVHNELLQGLAELGIICAVLLGWFLWRLRLAQLPAHRLPAAAATLIAGVLCLVSFPLQTPSSAFVIAAALGITAQGSRAVSWEWFCSPWFGPRSRAPGSSQRRATLWTKISSGRSRQI